MRKLVIGNNLDRTSVLELDLLRGKLRLLYRVIQHPTRASDRKAVKWMSKWIGRWLIGHKKINVVEARVQYSLIYLYSQRTSKCAGKILNRAMRKYHLMNDIDISKHIAKLTFKHVPLDAPHFVITCRVFKTYFGKSPSGKQVVRMNPHISSREAIQVANYCTQLIRTHVPKKYLKRRPRLPWQH